MMATAGNLRAARSATPYMVRLRIEQRLLSALFRWPRVIDLEPQCFVLPSHAALFEALQEAQETWPVESLGDSWRWHAYDDALLLIVSELVERNCMSETFNHVGGVKTYLTGELFQLAIGPGAIAELAALVRACPRCGR